MSDKLACHISKATQPEDWDKLNRNSLETTCQDCLTYFTKEWKDGEEPPTNLLCPQCGSENHGAVGSPAGGMNLLLHMDID